MQISSGTILKIFADNMGTLFFPNVFARILDLASTPLKPDEIADKLFYKRPSGAGFVGQKTASVVVEQILGLLAEIGLVEKIDGVKFQAVDTNRLGTLLTKARNELGDFGATPSGYVKDVRSLSKSFQQLAFQLKINEDQLKLIRNDLDKVTQQLPSLNIDSQKQVPADQKLFLSVATSVRGIRSQVTKVFHEPLEAIPPIDPQTLSQNIQTAGSDSDYQSYSVDYRVRFLKALSVALEEKRKGVQTLIQALGEKLNNQYSKNADGSGFPIRPLELLLSQASQDLNEQDITLDSELVTAEISANLKVYMMAGELDKAFKRISLYTSWFGDVNSNSYTNQFVGAYDSWQAVIDNASELESLWNEICEYFEADPDKSRWISTDLEEQQEGIIARITNFDTEFLSDFPKPHLKDLSEEVDETESSLADLIESANEAYENGKKEITDAINKTSLAALTRLSSRLGQPSTVTDKLVFDEKRHIDQHQKVAELEKKVITRGTELLGNENLFKVYVEIFRKYQKPPSPNWLEGYDQAILRELKDKKAIDLNIQITLNI
jgi:hypothetical protein